MSNNKTYFKSDIELFEDITTALRKTDIFTFDEFIQKLKYANITSFEQIMKYLDGVNADKDLVVSSHALIDRLRKFRTRHLDQLISSRQVGEYLSEKCDGIGQEQFYVLYLDVKQQIIAEKKVFQGTVNKAVVSPVEIFHWAVLYHASNVIVGHNHPSGDLTPSLHDLEFTKRLKSAGELIKVDVLDHFIVGGGKYLSFCEEGLF